MARTHDSSVLRSLDRSPPVRWLTRVISSGGMRSTAKRSTGSARTRFPFLVDQDDRLPKGKMLDVAMGEGRNGVFLAAKGFQVTGINISERGLQKGPHRQMQDTGQAAFASIIAQMP